MERHSILGTPYAQLAVLVGNGHSPVYLAARSPEG